MKFDKQPITFEQQVELLIERGLVVEDKDKASFYLSHIHYYRFGSYAWSFVEDHQNHIFVKDTTFEQVLDLYIFDRELRLLMLDAIERIETSFRTQWSYHLSHTYGSHPHLNKRLLSDNAGYDKQCEKLQLALNRTDDSPIKHQLHKYDEEMPAIWVVCEVMSLGQLSYWYKNLRIEKDARTIAKAYGLHHKALNSYLHHLTTVRNLCAHHSRLWNREFTFKMKLPTKGNRDLLDSFNQKAEKQIYNTLVMTEYLVDRLSPNHHWKERLKALIDKHESTDLSTMGFPEGWLSLPIWKKKNEV
ncbi:MAG: abortive infection bacteriophage resistance protein [Polaribacter sp.]|jgi:abortive infection bacteriophage resistance protein